MTTVKEHLDRHDRKIAGIIESLGRIAVATEANTAAIAANAAAIAANDRQIEALTRQSEKGAAETQALRALVMDTVRQWQAYINTLPRH